MPYAVLRAAPFVAMLSLAACASDPIAWRDETAALSSPEVESLLALGADGRPGFAPLPPAPPSSPAAEVCPGSLRTVTVPRGSARALVAVWWAPRPDGSARLLGAESLDGGARWSAPVPVDTLDRATRGCARPAPAVAADSATGYVHVAYALWAPEGAGVFFSHVMPGHFMFHAPVVVAYGERPGQVSVAAWGNDVAVAYEDPNARAPRVGLALSRSQGHAFEHRALEATGPGDASRPHVALHAGTIALAWTRVPLLAAAAAGTVPPSPTTVVRVGKVRK